MKKTRCDYNWMGFHVVQRTDSVAITAPCGTSLGDMSRRHLEGLSRICQILLQRWGTP